MFSLAPTPTFHVGFWFNDPENAAPCRFTSPAPTPFNGDHNAGPAGDDQPAERRPPASGPCPPRSAPSGLQYFPLSAPVRLLDTRAGQSAFQAPGHALAANQTLNVPGHFTFGGVTVPAAAVALVGNATVDNSSAPVAAGFATLFPSGQTRPTTSNLNFVPGTVRPNEFTVALGADGLQPLQQFRRQLPLDITGFYAPPGVGGLFFHPLGAPVRLLDTRPGNVAANNPGHPLAPNQPLPLNASFTFNGITVPAGVRALAGNATVDNSTANAPPGFATLFPGGQPQPNTSTLNFVPGTVAPNAFIVGVGSGGTFNLLEQYRREFHPSTSPATSMPTRRAGSSSPPLGAPVRELDTRAGQAAFQAPGQPLAPNQIVRARGSRSPSTGSACRRAPPRSSGNATVDNSANPAPPGFATLFPSGASLPLASNLNFVPGTVAPNAFIVGLGTGGTYNLLSNTGGNFIIDITGYFSAGQSSSSAASAGAQTPPTPAAAAAAPTVAPGDPASIPDGRGSAGAASSPVTGATNGPAPVAAPAPRP